MFYRPIGDEEKWAADYTVRGLGRPTLAGCFIRDFVAANPVSLAVGVRVVSYNSSMSIRPTGTQAVK